AAGTYVISDAAFQSSGTATFYLPTNSPYRHAGTTSIDSTLLASLAHKTTQVPDTVPAAVSLNTTLYPSLNVPRESTSAPDSGFAYDVVDYAVNGLDVTNTATLTLANGVVIGVYGANGTMLEPGSRLISQGSRNA